MPSGEPGCDHQAPVQHHAHGGLDVRQTAFSASRTIRVPRQAVWDMVADPAQHHRFDGTGMVGSLASARPTEVGDVFTMNMTYTTGDSRLDYQSDNHVVSLDPGVCFAWATALPGGPPLGWTWRYDLTDGPDGTNVRLSYDWTEAPAHNIARFGVPLADPASLARSLDRLAHTMAAGKRPGGEPRA